MRDFGKNKSMLPIREIMEGIKKETDYGREGLVTMLPFLRADNDGTYRLVIPLLEKVALREGEKPTHIVIRKVLYADVATGEVVAQEEAMGFFQQYALGDGLAGPVPMFRADVDKSLAEEYRRRQIGLIEKARQEVCENGECTQDTYMDYLKYSLYYMSDEFAGTLLYLSRTFSTDTSMVLECRECHKKTARDVRGYQEGQLAILDCPYCQKPIHAVYHKSGCCITYNDRYMRQERNRFLEMPAPAVQEGFPTEGIFDTDTSFSISGTLASDGPCQQDQGEGQAADIGQWPDAACQDEKVIGLVPVKKLFKIIRSMSFLADGASPAPIFALLGDQGCGINTSIRCLSGYQDRDILYTDLSLITEECLHTFEGCIVIRLYAGNKVPVWLPAALGRLKKRTMVFLAGPRDAGLPEELAAHVVYRISYKPYAIEDLSALLASRLASYGLRASLTKEQQMQILKNKNALDVKHLCQQLYFKHKMALYDGKALDDVISWEEIAREVRGVSGKGQRLENG